MIRDLWGALVGRMMCFTLYFSNIFLIRVWGINWKRWEIIPRKTNLGFSPI